MINGMHDITAGVCEHLDITSNIYTDLIIEYTEKILRNSSLEKILQILLACKKTARWLAGNQWNLGEAGNVTMD